MKRACAIAVLLASLACGGGETERDAASAPPDSVMEPVRPPTAEGDAVARFRSRLPEDLLRREGACPFECCGYRTWSEPADLTLLSEPRTGLPIDTIPAGERFEAETGIVFVTGLLLAVASDTLGKYGDPRPDTPIPEWWVRARRTNGTVGWFLQPRNVAPEGADLCA